MARTHGKVNYYSDWCQPKLVSNAPELLMKDLARLKVKPDYIHLCLTTDPFMIGFPEVTDMSLKLISIINTHGLRCSVLTKGRLPAELADRNRFNADNHLGISLISLNEEFRKYWEPNSASYSDRIGALRELHEKGCRSYVHMEPYATPNIVKQDLGEILKSVSFADEIFFSGWNYNDRVKQYSDYKGFYRDQADIVRRFCQERGIKCNFTQNMLSRTSSISS